MPFASVSPVRRALGSVSALCLLLSCSDSPSAPAPNRPPELQIAAPSASLLFKGGDSLTVSILATDPEDGALAASAVSWWVDLHHAEHTHPFQPVTAGAAGLLGIPRLGHANPDIFLRVYARAVDEAGAAETTYVDVQPAVTTLSLASVPSGLQLTLDGQPRTTPYSEQTVVGMQREVDAVDPQGLGESAFSYRQWQDVAPRARTIITPSAPLTLTAEFDSVGPANSAPSISLNDPVAGAVLTVNTPYSLSAEASDADGTVTAVTFEIDGAAIGTATAPPYSIEWIPTAVGIYLVGAVVQDDDGAFRRTESVAVTVQAAGEGDVAAPEVSLLNPADGSTGLIGSVHVTALATDNTGVTHVEFRIDDSTFASVDAPPYEASVPATTDFASGAHVIAARARDAAGNWSPWARATVSFGGAVALPAGFSRSTYANGLDGIPTAMAFAPDGRLFVAEQGGALRVIKDGTLLPTPFVTVPTIAYGERGLLGLAFDPDFAQTGWIYLYYTSSEGETHNRIVRYSADGDLAVAGSEVTLVELPPVADGGRHNGGAMHFGPDGKLYVAVGDATRPLLAASLESPFGKLLRFNRNGTIPADNPFYGTATGLNRAIWARGLRNPFAFAIHPTTGRMHINDVGEGTWEEINVGRAGADFGWPQTEGPTADPGLDGPLLAYRHSSSPTLFEGIAVVGAGFYPADGGSFGPAFGSDYFFGDFGAGWIYRLDASDGWRPYAFAQLGARITGLAIGPDGALYVLTGSRVERLGR